MMGQQMFDLPGDKRPLYEFKDYLKSQGVLVGGFISPEDKKIMKKIYEAGYIYYCKKNNFKAEIV